MRSSAPRLLAVVAFAALGCGGSDVPAGGSALSGTTRPLSDSPTSGIATFYDADGAGNCSFDPSRDRDVTAVAMPIYADSAACGTCLQVTGERGDVIVRVVDSCPPCEERGVDLDLSAEAFAKVADPNDGRVTVTYRKVTCPTTGPISYRFKEGSSQYWTAIQIRNHRTPIAKVEYDRFGTWTPIPRASYNYFVEARGVGAQNGPFKVRVTSTTGDVVQDELPWPVPDGKTIAGSRQLGQ